MTSSGAWWRLLLAAPGLLVLVIVASGLGVEAWFLGVFVVLLAAACAAAGTALGLVTLLARRTAHR